MNEHTTEEGLLARLRAGDEAAYEALVREQGPRMLRVIRRFLHHENDAQDALQDAFLSAFRGLAEFQGEARLSTWLHRIAVNAALMKLRKAKRTDERSIEDLLPRFLDDGHAVEPVVAWTEDDATLERQETRALVREQITMLPETYRTVLLLRDIEGLDTEETARLLGVTPNAVKIRLHRARQALRTLLDPHLRRMSS